MCEQGVQTTPHPFQAPLTSQLALPRHVFDCYELPSEDLPNVESRLTAPPPPPKWDITPPLPMAALEASTETGGSASSDPPQHKEQRSTDARHDTASASPPSKEPKILFELQSIPPLTCYEQSEQTKDTSCIVPMTTPAPEENDEQASSNYEPMDNSTQAPEEPSTSYPWTPPQDVEKITQITKRLIAGSGSATKLDKARHDRLIADLKRINHVTMASFGTARPIFPYIRSSNHTVPNASNPGLTQEELGTALRDTGEDVSKPTGNREPVFHRTPGPRSESKWVSQAIKDIQRDCLTAPAVKPSDCPDSKLFLATHFPSGDLGARYYDPKLTPLQNLALDGPRRTDWFLGYVNGLTPKFPRPYLPSHVPWNPQLSWHENVTRNTELRQHRFSHLIYSPRYEAQHPYNYATGRFEYERSNTGFPARREPASYNPTFHPALPLRRKPGYDNIIAQYGNPARNKHRADNDTPTNRRHSYPPSSFARRINARSTPLRRTPARKPTPRSGADETS